MTDDAIDTSVPHSARVWNYWLGGRDNYEVDRLAGDRYRAAYPGVVDVARACRGFLARSVRHLAGPVGIRQFLDIGAGLPAPDNVHEIAQRIAPESRVVYVDNDPLVLAHARALLVSGPKGAADYVAADLRDPEKILVAARTTLDLTRPVGLLLNGVLGHIGDDEEARSIVRRLLDGLPSGSHLAVNDGTKVVHPRESAEGVRGYNATGAVPYRLRDPEQIAGFLDGLDLVPPGVVSCSRWHPEAPREGASIPEVDAFCGVGRKP
ncbi:SAM-dependent methyltransferase [Streptomyces sp. B6B3]|uniref:SAM-dependent methyltransferase n=1 Tax=Streptomyces sp. B6B3 TaxID=3153570 RepID=UPI00325D5348